MLISISLLFVMFALAIFIARPSLIYVLFALEIWLLGISLNFILGSLLLDDLLGQFIALILFAIAALDTSVGLVIILNYYNLHLVPDNLIKS